MSINMAMPMAGNCGPASEWLSLLIVVIHP
jgi:hypothetical protein